MAIIVEATEVEDDDIGEASRKLPVPVRLRHDDAAATIPKMAPAGLVRRHHYGVSGECSSWGIMRRVTTAALASKT
jgi:hypothetical protein